MTSEGKTGAPRASAPAMPSPEGSRARVGPIVLLPPVLVLLLGATLLWRGAGRSAPAPPTAPPAPLSTEVAAWTAAFAPERGAGGGAAGEGGARVVLRLAPLHAEPERQAFDAAALARWLDLGPGEPWLARLEHAAPRESADAPTGEPAAALPATLAVTASEGAARLAPLVPPRLRAASEPTASEPLRALLAPPMAPLPPGRSLRLVLWGPPPRPGDRARIALADGRELAAPLVASPLAGAELHAALHGALARLAPAVR